MGRCESAKAEIIEDTKNKNIHCQKCDLASFESITAFAEKFMLEQSKLDILINYDGVMGCKRHVTKEGIKWQLGVNPMDHFLLTHLLLELLKNSAPSRIVVVSSFQHHAGSIDLNDLNSERHHNSYRAYAQSKLANILFAQELAKQLKDSGVTAIRRKFRQFLKWPFMETPQNGAQTTLFVALGPSLKEVTGKYFTDCRENNIGKQARDDDMEKWFWEASENWVLRVVEGTKTAEEQQK